MGLFVCSFVSVLMVGLVDLAWLFGWFGVFETWAHKSEMPRRHRWVRDVICVCLFVWFVCLCLFVFVCWVCLSMSLMVGCFYFCPFFPVVVVERIDSIGSFVLLLFLIYRLCHV